MTVWLPARPRLALLGRLFLEKTVSSTQLDDWDLPDVAAAKRPLRAVLWRARPSYSRLRKELRGLRLTWEVVGRDGRNGKEIGSYCTRLLESSLRSIPPFPANKP